MKINGVTVEYCYYNRDFIGIRDSDVDEIEDIEYIVDNNILTLLCTDCELFQRTDNKKCYLYL